MAIDLSAQTRSLLPREHGAYAQLGVSLTAALGLVPVSGRAWAQATATALAFLASEPFLILAGRRGESARGLGRRAAQRRLASCGLLLIPLLGWTWFGASLGQALSILPAAVLGFLLLGLFLAKREHSLGGELLAAGAFSLSALPVLMLGGATRSRAWTVALGLAALHGLGTTIVRAYLQARKPGVTAGYRTLPVLLGLGLTTGLWTVPVPRILVLAPLPLTAVALWVRVAPPSPRELRRLGWALTVGSALGALILVKAAGW